ncbi:MAG: tetratricopeptide repeat protein, partial [Thermoleophilia bacterium]|nr:tetratricopeptide repeat protein [Thermoleophilia bacterium]
NASVLNNLAYALSEMLGQPQRALPHAQRAADLASSNGPILDTLGWVRYQLGNYDEAETALRRSVQLEPTATTYYHLACVFHKKGDRRAAERQLQRAVELKPDPETQAKINRLANDIRTRGTDGE